MKDEEEFIEACGHESCPVDGKCEHCKEPVKVARLKVPAPTVATDNSGDVYTIYKNGKLLEPDPNFNPLSVRCASPVEEEQDQLWQEAINLIDYTSQNRAVEMLKEKFILTRKEKI